MTLLRNLTFAERAVKFANDQLRGQSSNRPEDIAHTLLANLNQQFAASRLKTEIISTILSSPERDERMDRIRSQRIVDINRARTNRNAQGRRLIAAAIMQDNLGNCFEHCVLAGHYLNRWRIASYIAETDDDNVDHVFVLIGFPDGLDGKTINVTTQRPPMAGAFTVVCDPWYHEWFSVHQDWGRKMWHIFRATKKNQGLATPDSLKLKLISSRHVT